eukprot:gb/GFBE01076660.1/.p1 GENE.gb/GFBE01076660.1/~~gb/GFBE01076660.1/.p1  ORF type:complete len:375 (+),score=78.78 gb/GFBE01076660.1/:1-1125(+)
MKSAQEDAHVQTSGGEQSGMDLVTILRSTEELLPFGVTLRAAGGALLAVGMLWAGYHFLTAHWYVLLIFAGLACLALSFVAEREGLLRYLPPDVQDLLLNKTLFDFFQDDSAVKNGVRKWGRVQMLALQDGTSEGDVKNILEDMDPELVNLVLRRNFISFLPLPLMRLLLPEASRACSQGAEGGDAATCSSSASSSGRQPGTATNSAMPSMPWILNFLQQKTEEKNKRITEPAIEPLIKQQMGLGDAMKGLKTYGRMLLGLLKALSLSAASGWFASAGLFYFGSGSSMLVRACAAGGLMSRTPSDETLKRTSQLATAISLLSAGGAVALSAYFSRFSKLIEETQEDGPSSWDPTRLFEPEREESPPNSEAPPKE